MRSVGSRCWSCPWWSGCWPRRCCWWPTPCPLLAIVFALHGRLPRPRQRTVARPGSSTPRSPPIRTPTSIAALAHAERRDLLVDRRRCPRRRLRRLDVRVHRASTRSWCHLVIGLVLQAVGLVALVLLVHEHRETTGWAAARESAREVPSVVSGAVRLISRSRVLSRARARRVPVGLRDDRLRDRSSRRGSSRCHRAGPTSRGLHRVLGHGRLGAVGGRARPARRGWWDGSARRSAAAPCACSRG